MACVEIVPHEGTDPETVEAASAFVRSLGKTPVKLKREVPGFLANRLLNALRREALDLYEGGVADFEDIDLAAKTALGHPMGPFELMDLVGIDVVHLIRLAEYEQTGDPAALPARSIKEKYEAGTSAARPGGAGTSTRTAERFRPVGHAEGTATRRCGSPAAPPGCRRVPAR